MLAGLLPWIYPAAFVLASTKGRMYYGAGTALAAAAVLLVLRLDERLRIIDVGLLGLVLGLALWATPFAVLARCRRSCGWWSAGRR